MDENLYCYQDCSASGESVDYDDDGDGIKSSDDFYELDNGTRKECRNNPDCDNDLLLDGLEIPDQNVTELQLSYEVQDADQDQEPDGAEILGGSLGSRDPLDSSDGLYDATTGVFCGDGTCQAVINDQPFESTENCIADCWCGNYVCEASESATGGEDTNGNPLTFCPNDCSNEESGSESYCGDGTCDADNGEDSATCSEDCGTTEEESTGSYCGDGVCDADNSEDSVACPEDCETTEEESTGP